MVGMVYREMDCLFSLGRREGLDPIFGLVVGDAMDCTPGPRETRAMDGRIG